MFKEIACGIGGGLIAVGAYGLGSYLYNKSRNANLDKLIQKAKDDGIIEQSEPSEATSLKEKFLAKMKKTMEKEKAARPAETKPAEVKVFKTEEVKA